MNLALTHKNYLPIKIIKLSQWNGMDCILRGILWYEPNYKGIKDMKEAIRQGQGKTQRR